MQQINIYTNRQATIEASEYINNNRKDCLIYSDGDNNYYLINGHVWQWRHEYLGSYPYYLMPLDQFKKKAGLN